MIILLLKYLCFMIPKKLQDKIEQRKTQNTLRQLGTQHNLVDFSSNDYLGFSISRDIFDLTHHFLEENFIKQNGSRGSRLLTGNHQLYGDVEDFICSFHNTEAALIFNSGYDANLGFFSSVPQRGDIILYDEYIHASIRDGITMSNAKSYKFNHNDLSDIVAILNRVQHNEEVYIVTESVFSMDGDSPDLKAFAKFCSQNKYHFIVDEAHAVGVFGNKGVGLIQALGLETNIFARIITFGKAFGSHGAAILGSEDLKQYLINFSRPFIYTTALPPHSLMTLKSVYKELAHTHNIEKLHENIDFFKLQLKIHQLKSRFIESNSAIQCCIIRGNENVKSVSNMLNKKGFDVKPILSPTVPLGHERLRFCLHSYNSHKEISEVLQLLATFVK